MRKQKDTQLYRFGVSMEEQLVRGFDDFVSSSGYRNRSEAIRELIRRHLSDYEPDTAEGEVAAILSIFYTSAHSSVDERISNLRREFSAIILGGMEIPLREKFCAEAFGLFGESRRIRELVHRVRAIEGVHFADVVSVPFEYLKNYFSGGKAPLHEENPLHSFVENMPENGPSPDMTAFEKFLSNFQMQGKTLLDAGCGSGYSTEILLHLVTPGGRVIGVDFSQRALHIARQRVGPKAEFRHEDLLDISLPQHSVDIVVCHNTFSTILDQAAFLRTLRRVLKPLGQVIVFEDKAAAVQSDRKYPIVRRLPSYSELYRMVSAAGMILQRNDNVDNYIFVSSTPGMVAHSGDSRLRVSRKEE